MSATNTSFDSDDSGHSKQGEESKPVDTLPDDLDITKYVGPYQFPSPTRRKTAAYGIFVISAITLFFGFQSNNMALIVAAVLSALLGAVFYLTAWPLNLSDTQALTKAATQAPFSVGHASAQLSFTSWFSRPTWRVVVFSSDEPPTQRGLVEINAVSEQVISSYFDKEGVEKDA